jgi:tRNA 2-thiouridine synthesizing protein E
MVNDYAQMEVDGQLDCEGFLTDHSFWSSEFAEDMAKMNDIAENGLTEDQWKVINYVRNYYKKRGRGPTIVKVIKNTGLSLEDICNMFTCGLVKGAYKLAGLPKPPGCT